MPIVLAGSFEFALTRGLAEQYDPTSFRTPQPYWQSFLRYAPKAYFDRSATFCAVADSILLPTNLGIGSGTERQREIAGTPRIDWQTFLQPAGKQLAQDFGLHADPRVSPVGGESYEPLRGFCAILLQAGAFTTGSLQRMRRVFADSTGAAPSYLMEGVEGVGSAEFFPMHYLVRLLAQVTLAGEHSYPLAISLDDQQILQEVNDFVRSRRMPTPIVLPDLASFALIDDGLAGALLNFAPADAEALRAVRADAIVRKYAAKVRRAMTHAPTAENQLSYVDAMKEARNKSEIVGRVQSVFEVISWACKPLEYVPVVGELVSAGQDAIEAMQGWLARKKSNLEWYLISAKMTEVATNDYLRRFDNRR